MNVNESTLLNTPSSCILQAFSCVSNALSSEIHINHLSVWHSLSHYHAVLRTGLQQIPLTNDWFPLFPHSWVTKFAAQFSMCHRLTTDQAVTELFSYWPRLLLCMPRMIFIEPQKWTQLQKDVEIWSDILHRHSAQQSQAQAPDGKTHWSPVCVICLHFSLTCYDGKFSCLRGSSTLPMLE